MPPLLRSFRPVCSPGLVLLLVLILTACQPRVWQVASVQPGADPAGAATPVTAAAPVDSAAEQFIRPFRRQVITQMSEVVASSDTAWLKPGKLGNNAPLTTWVARVLRIEAGRSHGSLPDFAALTNGSIRSGLPAGPVTVGHVFELMPFENELTVLSVPGPIVQQLFDYAAKYDNVAAVNASWVKSPAGAATDVRIAGRPLDLSRTYTLAINDYLANGGDGMSFLRPLRPLHANRTIRQAILDYLRREKTIRYTDLTR